MDTNKYLDQLKEVETRWTTFLSKMNERLDELLQASIPELEDSFQNDSDEFKRAYYRLRGGIEGQVSHMRDKANKVKEENVDDLFNLIRDEIDIIKHTALRDALYDFRDRCRELHDTFDDKLNNCYEIIRATEKEDLEAKYQYIIDEYERIKDQFSCKQCSSPISIPKIFFTTTHIECPSCQTQNTFEPSSQAKLLDRLARSLSEERTAHLLLAYEQENNKERDLYHQIHQLKLNRINFEIEKNKQKLAEINEETVRLEAERKASIAKAPELYKQYLKAQFEEWIRLVPGLEEQNRRVYESRLREYERQIS